MSKIIRYDIDAEINLNGEAYHFRDRNMHSGEYVLYEDVEDIQKENKVINRKLNIALSAFQKILDSDVQPYDFIYKTFEEMGKIE